MIHFVKTIESFKDKVAKSGQKGPVEIDFREMMSLGFESAITEILFGNEEQIELDNKPIIRTMSKFLNEYFEMFSDNLFLYSYRLSHNWKLTKRARDLYEKEKRSIGKLVEVYKNRKASY